MRAMLPCADSDREPMPEAPPPPDLEACCGNGCDPCIFDLHDLAMDRYRRALRAWCERHPDAPAADGRSAMPGHCAAT